MTWVITPHRFMSLAISLTCLGDSLLDITIRVWITQVANEVRDTAWVVGPTGFFRCCRRDWENDFRFPDGWMYVLCLRHIVAVGDNLVRYWPLENWITYPQILSLCPPGALCFAIVYSVFGHLIDRLSACTGSYTELPWFFKWIWKFSYQKLCCNLLCQFTAGNRSECINIMTMI